MRDLYQLWLHRSTREAYAVRLQWDPRGDRLSVVGVCGLTDRNHRPAGDAFPPDLYHAGSFARELQARRPEFIALPPPGLV